LQDAPKHRASAALGLITYFLVATLMAPLILKGVDMALIAFVSSRVTCLVGFILNATHFVVVWIHIKGKTRQWQWRL
jgi:hypothetical protein